MSRIPATVVGTPITHRQPQAVDPLREGGVAAAGSELPGDPGRGAVGEEDAETDEGLQHGARDPEAGQLPGAEVADHRGVAEEEERLGDQREEGGYGEPPDLAVVGGQSEPTHGDPSTVEIGRWYLIRRGLSMSAR